MNRSRRDILFLGAAGLLGAPGSPAQPSPKRVVWLGPGEKGQEQERIRKTIASQGLVEGRDLTLSFEEIRASSKESAETQADELIKRRPDVIVTVAHWLLDLLKRRTLRIPIVFYNVGFDPSRLGWVESLRRPGANITGTTNMGDQWMTKQWQLLKDLSPSLKRGGLCWFKEDMAVEQVIEAALGLESSKDIVREVNREIETRLRIEILDLEVSKGAGRDEFAAAVMRSQAEALAFHSDVSDVFVDFLKTSKVPACGHRFASLRRGILMCVSWDWLEGETQAAAMTARILRGESPATMPVYRNNRHFVGVNLRTAHAMGIKIPAAILLQSDLVVE